MKTSLIFVSIFVMTLISGSVAQNAQPNEDLGIPNDWIQEMPMDGGGGEPPNAMPIPEAEYNPNPEGVPAQPDPNPVPIPAEIPAEPLPDPVLVSVADVPEPNPATEPPKRPKLVEICDEPVIVNAINRFSNSTIRLYRDSSTWDLMGLPDRVGFTTGKAENMLPRMAPVHFGTAIVTILEGEQKDITFRFEKQYFWAWDQDGVQQNGGRGGEYWDLLPKGGFTTAFHNGNASKPMIIAFKDDLVYYISTKEKELDFLGNPDGHIGGKNGENFPPNIASAFAWPLGKKIMIYLFRDDKFCLREFTAPESGKDCDEWRETRELFGCIPKTQAPDIPAPGAPAGANPVPPSDTNAAKGAAPPPPVKVMAAGGGKNDTGKSTGLRISANQFVSILICSSTLFLTFV